MSKIAMKRRTRVLSRGLDVTPVLERLEDRQLLTAVTEEAIFNMISNDPTFGVTPVVNSELISAFDAGGASFTNTVAVLDADTTVVNVIGAAELNSVRQADGQTVSFIRSSMNPGSRLVMMYAFQGVNTVVDDASIQVITSGKAVIIESPAGTFNRQDPETWNWQGLDAANVVAVYDLTPPDDLIAGNGDTREVGASFMNTISFNSATVQQMQGRILLDLASSNPNLPGPELEGVFQENEAPLAGAPGTEGLYIEPDSTVFSQTSFIYGGTPTFTAADLAVVNDIFADLIGLADGETAFATAIAAPGAGVVSDFSPVTTPQLLGSDFATDLGIEIVPVSRTAVVELAAIGDYVWLDKNADGIQDANEDGIPGVTVRLLDSADNVLDTRVTDADGLYLFSNLTPGDYKIQFVAPAGLIASDANQGANDAVDSDGEGATLITVLTTLDAGETDLTWDQGFYELAEIGDFVWEDKNADGIQDAGEPGVANVTVELYNCDGEVFVDDTTTDADGKYLFSGLKPGTYHVKFITPAGYVITTQDVGGDDEVDSDAIPTGVLAGEAACTTLESGESDLTWDAGIYRPAEIGDFVWEDKNADGIQDAGEPAIQGVKVELYNCDGEVFVAETTTDANGKYLFTGLKPGTYHVKFYTPTGFILTTQDVGANDGIDSDAIPTGVLAGEAACTTLESGESDLTWDAGMYQLAALGDYVWFDADQDGQQDGDEVGVANVTVHLLDSSDVILDTMQTDGAGFYLFDNLTPGSYKVQFELPAGFDGFTIKDTGSDITDSDADLVTGITGIYVLVSGQTDLTVDAGLVRTPVLTPDIDIEKYVKVIEECEPHNGGGEGLTPGFWKTHSEYGPAPHKGWQDTGYDPDDSYEAIFNVNVSGTPSLLDALGKKGGGVNALMRHSAAALLNAANPNVDYAYSVAEVLAMTKAAIDSGDSSLIESTKNLFETENELGADLSTPAVGGHDDDCEPDNGIGEDADSPTGPLAQTGDQVMFTYIVTNPGEVELSNIVIVDDNATPGDNTDDFSPTPTLADGFNIGDLDKDNNLDIGEEWVYTATITAGAAGQYKNIAVVTGTAPDATQVTDEDPAHYLVDGPVATPGIDVEKYVKSETAPAGDLGDDADSPTGPAIELGDDAIFTYLVKNTGDVELSNVTLTDDNATAGDLGDDFAPVPVLDAGFNVGDTDKDNKLDVGETWKYVAAVTTVSVGQYVNVAKVSATAPDASVVEDSDPAHYIVQQTNGDFTGLTPGFWKQKQHFQYWVGYTTSMKFETVFGVNIPGSNYSLLEAVSLGGGGMNALMRHAVAALLNASHPDVNYKYSVNQVISMVQAAFASGDYETTKNLFEKQNELGDDIK